MKIKISNTFLIFFFFIFVLTSIINSKEFKNFSSFFLKKDDEIFYKFKILKHNHYVYLKARNNKNFIGFIRELDFEKALKSFVNREGRSQVLMFHNYWGLEKAKEIYKINNENVFRLPFLTEKFLEKNQININDKCSEVRKSDFSKLKFLNKELTNIKLINNQDNLSRGLYYFKIKINTSNQFLSLTALDNNHNIINRSEIDLDNLNHPKNHSYSNKILNSSTNIILLDTGSENNSGAHNQVTHLWLLYYVNNYQDFSLLLNPYNSKEDFIMHSDSMNSILDYKINSVNKDFEILENNLKIILCK